MKTNSQNSRAFWHDYRSACRYLITLSKSADMPAFSQIAGDWRIPVGTRGSSYTQWSPLGRVIADTLYHIAEIHPALRTEQYTVMPDHVHFLLWVREELPDPLGLYIARFKNVVNVASGKVHVFEDGFNDQIVSNKRDLDTIFRYIRSNPYRLAVRRACPDFFTRCSNVMIGDTLCQLYGNVHLLQNPFKDQVVVHRADSDVVFGDHRERWRYTAVNGGVLVSPFISQREKVIRGDTEAAGGRLILIANRPFGEREKPSGRDFELCAAGRMLIVAPMVAMPLDRGACLRMNSLAEAIALG